MRTSLNEIQQIEEYLLQQASEEDAGLFEAKLILQPDLQEQVRWQQKVYDLVRQYSRLQLKADIEAAHRTVFADRSFAAGIQAIFS